MEPMSPKERGGDLETRAEDNGKIVRINQELRERLDFYDLIFDSIHSGAIVTDADGFVTHFNKPLGQFLGLDAADQIGRHCTQVLDDTRMHIVAQSGIPEINRTRKVKGRDTVMQCIPIRRGGKVVAVYGQVMFKDVRDAHRLAREQKLLESKIKLYEAELSSLRATRYTFESIIGTSLAIDSLKQEARRAAANKSPVLISGESGTGKELFAQAIHQGGERRLYPFVRINCAAIPRDLLESELFGYEGGAFTGALSAGKPGKFELAHQGTIFLDEIGDLPLEMQPTLLRVLEEKEFERVGGNRIIHSDFRLIAATNHSLEKMLRQGRFRKDLYYRLNVFHLDIPPLRQRREDIAALSRHLLQMLAGEANVTMPEIDSDAHQALLDYDWPGNVRELSNALERVLSARPGKVIRLEDLPFHVLRPKRAATANTASIRQVRLSAEKDAIVCALKACHYNKSKAARMLGIHRTLLYKKMKQHGLPVDPSANPGG